MSRAARLWHSLRSGYEQNVDIKRRAAMRLWIAFALTFVFLRLLTYSIRYHLIPVANIVTSGGLHIHHFVWGILIILVVGLADSVLLSDRWRLWLAPLFGFGAALVIDEFALWLNLQDVYWAQEGRISVDVAVFIIGLLGIYVAGGAFWRLTFRQVRGAIRLAVRGEKGLRNRL